MLTIQTLVSTMYQKDYSLLDRMNIQTDAIVINQCDTNKIEEFEYKGHKILWMSLKERGVGLSRNTALMRATADIVLFADDDVCYEDSYASQIVKEFEKYSDTSFIVFSITSLRKGEIEKNKKEILPSKKRHWFNVLRFGTFHFAVLREKIIGKNIFFHLLFGGGAPYSCGEDTIFITEALKKGLKVRSSNVYIGNVFHNRSTWFNGYTEKYWFDKGILLRYIFGYFAYIIGVVLIIKHYKTTNTIGLSKVLKNLFSGIWKNKLC